MPFPPQLLTDDEELVLDLRPHWWYLAPPGAVLVVALLFGIASLTQDWPGVVEGAVGFWVLGALGISGPAVSRMRKGIVAKQGIEIPLDRINTVFFGQTLFERMIGAGDLGIESAGEGGRQTFTDIRKPSIVQNEIYRQVEGLETRKLRRMGQAASGGGAPAEVSIPEQIEQLDQLRRQGVVTEEEFQAKKRELLDRM